MAITVGKLLCRGDDVYIEHGRLVIRPASGKPIPQPWFQDHSPILIKEVLTNLRIKAYEYCSYTTGHYGSRKLPGLTLQFQNAVTGESAYAIFNAELTRRRNTEAGIKGAPLPSGHFRVGKRSHFYRFWQSTGIPEPKRLAAFHDYMGNLRGILFTAHETEGLQSRLDAGSLKTLSVPSLDVRKEFLPDSLRTIAKQMPDKILTRLPDKGDSQALAARGFQPKATTCSEYHGKAVFSGDGKEVSSSLSLSPKRPEEQTIDEWLADYCSQSDYTQTTRFH